MKKILGILTSALIVASSTMVYAGAKVSSQNIIYDGEKQDIKGYIIENNNYFKLRDVASLLEGKDVGFDVVYDSDRNAIKIERDGKYKKTADDLKPLKNSINEPKKSTHKVLVDGEEVRFTSYTIDGYNYFQLRELGKVVGFYVDFDKENSDVIVKSEQLDPKPLVNNQVSVKITNYVTSFDEKSLKISDKPKLKIEDFFENIKSNVVGTTEGQLSAGLEYIKAEDLVEVTPLSAKYVGKFTYKPQIKIVQGEKEKILDYDGEIDIEKVLKDNGFEPKNNFKITLGTSTGEGIFDSYSGFNYS